MNIGTITLSIITTMVRTFKFGLGSVEVLILTVLTLDPRFALCPAPAQLRIKQLAKKSVWHRDCHWQRYMDANQDLFGHQQDFL